MKRNNTWKPVEAKMSQGGNIPILATDMPIRIQLKKADTYQAK